MSEINPEHDAAWNEAVSARLRQLRSLPVDTSSLERAVTLELEPARETKDRRWWSGVLRPARAVAASLVLVAFVVAAVMLTASSGAVYAQPAQMAAMHRDLVSGQSPMMKADSVEAANRIITAEWAQSPELPNMPEKHVMACCLRRMNNKKIACVLLNDGGIPVSMMVADGSDVKNSRSSTFTKDGVPYQVESSDELNMVMTKRDGRWVCLVGDRPIERLIELSKSLKF